MKNVQCLLMIGSLFFLSCTGCLFPRFNVTVQNTESSQSVKYMTDAIQKYYDTHGQLPSRLSDVSDSYNLHRKPDEQRPRWEQLTKDGWGNPYEYERLSATTYRLMSWQEISVQQK